MKGKFAGTAGRGPFNDTMERVGVPEGVTLSHEISRLGTTAALNQDRTAIHHHGLPRTESFLHQK